VAGHPRAKDPHQQPAQTAAVKPSTWPLRQDTAKLFPTLRTFDAISAALLVEPQTASAGV
jgi:hypothetical protein